MKGRAWAALALLACGTLLLTTTQPWVRTVTQLAVGAPRARGVVTGTELVAWLAPVAVVVALGVVAGLSGMRWARTMALVAALAVLAGVLPVLVAATTGDVAAAVPGTGVVSAGATGWLWLGAASALAAPVLTALWWQPWRRGLIPDRPAAPPGPTPHDDPDGAEEERRRAAADWRELSEGGDPTDT